MKRVLVPFAKGVEELEFCAVVDVLRRCDGIQVLTASLDGQIVQGRSSISIMPDAGLDDVADDAWDAIVLPGGLPNAQLLQASPVVRRVCERLHAEHKLLAAICAAPWVLSCFALLEQRRLTSHPAFAERIKSKAPLQYVEDAVVNDSGLISSRGPATAVAFALAIVAELCDQDAADAIAIDLVLLV